MAYRQTTGHHANTMKRVQRATSNVFSTFDRAQIRELKEAFTVIDQGGDGFIDKKDLHDTLVFLGESPSDDDLEGMMKEVSGSINFAKFLMLFGQKLQGTDPDDVIENAFKCFDEDDKGVIHKYKLRELLTSLGDKFTHEEVDELYSEVPMKEDMFSYHNFTRILRLGEREQDDQ